VDKSNVDTCLTNNSKTTDHTKYIPTFYGWQKGSVKIKMVNIFNYFAGAASWG